MVYLALFLVGFIPTVFLFLLPKKEEFFQKNFVKSFGLGVYASLVFILIRESFFHAFEIGFFVPSFAIILGVVISFLISFYFKEFHHHHEHIDGKHDHHHTKASFYKILFSDFFHNIVDGMAVISGFLINNFVGFINLIGVLGHQIIQQFGEQILLVENGVKPKKAIFYGFLISLSVFLSLIIKINENVEVFLIAISSGIILFKVIKDIKEMKWGRNSFLGFITGFVILLLFLILIPHIH